MDPIDHYFKIYSFVFHRRKKVLQVWNCMRVSKLWSWNVYFWVKYVFKLCVFAYQILEPRFHSETLAMLLNIPPQKTLLRRHLATNFSMLVGLQAQQEKQEFANASGHTPLTTTAKVRVRYYKK